MGGGGSLPTVCYGIIYERKPENRLLYLNRKKRKKEKVGQSKSYTIQMSKSLTICCWSPNAWSCRTASIQAGSNSKWDAKHRQQLFAMAKGGRNEPGAGFQPGPSGGGTGLWSSLPRTGRARGLRPDSSWLTSWVCLPEKKMSNKF